MADYVFVGSTVLSIDEPSGLTEQAGEELEAGIWVYKNSADRKLYKADRTLTEAEAAVVGLTLNHAFIHQPVQIATEGAGRIQTSTSLGFAGKTFILSDTPGVMADCSDVPGLGRYYTLLAYSVSANIFQVQIALGVARS